MNGMPTASRASRSATLVWVSPPGFSTMKSTRPAAACTQLTRSASALLCWQARVWPRAVAVAVAARSMSASVVAP